MESNVSYYSGYEIGDKLYLHTSGPFDSSAEVQTFQKWACANGLPDGHKLVTVRCTTTKKADGKLKHDLAVL